MYKYVEKSVEYEQWKITLVIGTAQPLLMGSWSGSPTIGTSSCLVEESPSNGGVLLLGLEVKLYFSTLF